MEFVIITGMSGSGKSRAIAAMEDIGYYCVDNLPPKMVKSFTDLCLQAEDKVDKVALVIDARSREIFGDIFEGIEEFLEASSGFQTLFLDCEDATLIQRYKETRRSHPLAEECDSLEGAIALERRMLAPCGSGRSSWWTPPTCPPPSCGASVLRLFGRGSQGGAMTVSVTSFGFKYGLPLEADLVLDVRFLPNPFYKAELRQHNGLEEPVRDYLFQYEETAVFLSKLEDLLRFLLPLYEEEGKSSLVIAVGCTGGQHRSVAISHAIVQQIRAIGYPVTESHRDMTRERK